MRRFGVIIDELYMKHSAGVGHPESPYRLKVIYDALKDKKYADILFEIRPENAKKEDILLVHTENYYRTIENTRGLPYYYIDPDTATNQFSFDAAILAAGGVICGTKYVIQHNNGPVFALVRPPGHHAEPDRGMGFCLFNNVAIGAMYARKRLGVNRVMIFDWDLHHGNGTQTTFYEDNTVLYISVHQFPHYPGTGSFDEVGSGKGAGFTINIPFVAGAGDAEYIAVFEEIVKPVSKEFSPELILISAGFDPHYDDPLGGMKLTSAGFTYLGKKIVELSLEVCKRHPVFVLEGGYSLKGLRESVEGIILSCTGKKEVFETDSNVYGKPNARYLQSIERVKNMHSKFWRCFQVQDSGSIHDI